MPVIPEISSSPLTSSVVSQPPSKMCTKDDDLLEEIRIEMEKRRGSHLPTYEKPTVVEVKIKDFVNRCVTPVLMCLEKVSVCVCVVVLVREMMVMKMMMM